MINCEQYLKCNFLTYFQQTCTIKPEKKREIEVGLRPSMPSHDSSIFVDFRGEMVNNVIWKVAPKEFNGERYSRKSPFVFVGGHPRSGTTLMRSMFGRLTVITATEAGALLYFY